MIDFQKTIISQYDRSTTIRKLIENINEYIDPRLDIDSIYNYIWNVDTATGFGLDILGRIVNIDRYVPIPDINFFGFGEAESWFPFDDRPFFSGGEAQETSGSMLNDDDYRHIILCKALSNISGSDARSINKVLQYMFSSRGRCYVADDGGMHISYIFEFTPSIFEKYLILEASILPKPAGVDAIIIKYRPFTFGFSEMGRGVYPFNQGIFY